MALSDSFHNLSIAYHSKLQVYRPGETISGAVEFTLTEAKRYNCIKVTFLGSAHVKWTLITKSYVGIEKYVQSSLLLWSPQQSNGSSIGPGYFRFPFQFIIPSHVPSTYDHENTALDITNASAYISYMIEGRVVTGAFRFDHKASTPVIITRLVSISGANQVTPVRQVKRTEQLQVGFLCCAASVGESDVEFVANLPRTGYCVTNRDVIPLSVHVQNNSTRAIQMRARIIKRVVMFVRDNKNVSEKTVTEIFSRPIQPGGSGTWKPSNWIVPELCPTIFGCRIIDVGYILEVSADIPNAFLKIPLVMGNLPYMADGNLERALLGALIATLNQMQGRTSATAVRRENEEEEFDNQYNSSERDTLI